MNVSMLDRSKSEVFETYSFNLVATENDHPKYVKHVLGWICVFFTLFGYWARRWGSPKRLVHNLLVQFSILDSSTIEVTSQRVLDPIHASQYAGEHTT